MKQLLCNFLSPLLLAATLAPSQVYACGNGNVCSKDLEQKQIATMQQAENEACCESSNDLASCCEKEGTSQAGDHDCNGHCGGHCACPTVHSSALFFGDFLLNNLFSQLVLSEFSYTAPYLSNVSLDIWLPPDIRV